MVQVEFFYYGVEVIDQNWGEQQSWLEVDFYVYGVSEIGIQYVEVGMGKV